MSPLALPPTRGYADWQRVENYDSPLLFNATSPGNFAPFVFGVQDVSRFGYLGGRMQEQTSQSLANIAWFADPAATELMSYRAVAFTSNILNLAQLRFPNLGPFVRLTSQAFGATNYSLNAQLFGTNRIHPLELIPAFGVIIDQQGVVLPASGAVTLYPSDYYAGPARLVVSASQVYTWELQWLSTTGNWDIIDNQSNIAANVTTEQSIVTPPGAWRLIILNATAAAGIYFAAVTPSTTGGS
jgi:hypothetical protein